MQPQLLRVLLAEDSLTETGLMLRSLSADKGRGLELVYVSNRSAVARSLLQFHPHAAFLALSLLQPDAYLSVSLLHYAAPRIPLILFAPTADKDCVAKCLEAGAHDYMLDGFMDVATLDRVLHSAIQRDSQLAPLGPPKSCRDSLTGLPNRSGLLRSVRHALPDSPLTDIRLLVSIHLQNYKQLLASVGQAAVAQTLRHIAQQLQASVRRTDLLAHVSRGVFVMVIPDAGERCLGALQRRLESRLLNFNQRYPQLPFQFVVQAFPWRSSSPFSLEEILSSHLTVNKQSALPLLAAAGNLLPHSLVRSGQ
jgi:GGDEF domain-containing protein